MTEVDVQLVLTWSPRHPTWSVPGSPDEAGWCSGCQGSSVHHWFLSQRTLRSEGCVYRVVGGGCVQTLLYPGPGQSTDAERQPPAITNRSLSLCCQSSHWLSLQLPPILISSPPQPVTLRTNPISVAVATATRRSAGMRGRLKAACSSFIFILQRQETAGRLQV